MKKYYTTTEYKLRNERRIKDREYRRNRKGKPQPLSEETKEKIKINKVNEKLRINLIHLAESLKRLNAPSNFSIVNNHKEVIDFFEDLKNKIWDGIPIKLDMAEIQSITIDSVIYLLSVFDSFNMIGLSFHIQGNAPNKKECKIILENSGFFEFVLSAYKNKKYDDNFLSIKNDNAVSSEIAKTVMQFIIKHLKKDRNNLKDLQRILIEMMNNTIEHAYSDSNKKASKWYLIAIYDKNENNIKFSFLDMGVGIPYSINKKHSEKVALLIDKLNPFGKIVDDSKLIASALDGEFRTRTMQKWRGNGLPTILKASRENYIEDLMIYSNKGVVKANKNDKICEDTKSTFKGTLYSWKYI